MLATLLLLLLLLRRWMATVTPAAGVPHCRGGRAVVSVRLGVAGGVPYQHSAATRVGGLALLSFTSLAERIWECDEFGRRSLVLVLGSISC